MRSVNVRTSQTAPGERMIFYIESLCTDPCYNLALEQFAFDRLDRKNQYFMLWQNHQSVIVGKNQNTNAEINAAFVDANNIRVVRRLSGGGAVYHDLGNLNWTFISDAGKNGALNFVELCMPIQKALVSFGVPVEIAGRNDMTVGGKKISGSAQYIKEDRVMHHGTLLYDSDLEMLSQSLNVSGDKIESKGIKSVKSRVTNIRPSMKIDMPIKAFWTNLKNYMFDLFDMEEYKLTIAEKAEVQRLKEQVYSQWSWNFGTSPPYNVRKTRRIAGCGNLEILLDVGEEGVINNITFYGDFFGSKATDDLAVVLTGHRLEYNELKTLLSTINISQYFHALDTATFLALLLE